MWRLDHFTTRWRGGAGRVRPAWRRWLRRIGPSLEMAPLRRAIQGVALAVFLVLAFWSAWPYDAHPAPGHSGWPSTFADNLARKEFLPVDSFLAIDPLVSLSTTIAAHSWVWSLGCAAAVLAICLLVPRGFCGYLCPLGTLIDLFDWAVGRRVVRFRVREVGRWTHLRHLVLVASLVAALCGVMVAGAAAAIPLLTRGIAAVADPLVSGAARGWHTVPPVGWGQALSLAIFAGVLALGLLRPRFWCRHVCPTGAVFSLGARLRLAGRRVTSACIGCNQCVEACPFDAINPDWSTRDDACTSCQTCGGACPTKAITFVGRTAVVADEKPIEEESAQPLVSRRAVLGAGLAGACGAVGIRLSGPGAGHAPLLRPPGSLSEERFLDQCIRCDDCVRVCPDNVLQPLGFERGLDGLWTPVVRPDWAGCEPSCNACGQACPTGAIRALPIEEKRHARIGLAAVDATTCLPWAGHEACQLCVDACRDAGYDAIEFRKAHVEVGADGAPVEGSGFDAPEVDAAKCVGCGLCQSRCVAINVGERKVLGVSAITVSAAQADRIDTGSYRELREGEAAVRERAQRLREQGLGDAFR